MLKFQSYDIVFREIPNEVTLAINISGCQNRCAGCHSPWLWNDSGDLLDESALDFLLERYGSSVTCICFMGGDNQPQELARLALYIKQKNSLLKIAWYSGKEYLPPDFSWEMFDYVKLGRYDELYGGLTSRGTNQRFYSRENGVVVDRTNLFQPITT